MIKYFIDSAEQIKSTNSLKRVFNILSLYDELREEDGVNKQAFCKDKRVAPRTFTRYLCIIRQFLEDSDSGCAIGVNEYNNYEIVELD